MTLKITNYAADTHHV